MIFMKHFLTENEIKDALQIRKQENFNEIFDFKIYMYCFGVRVYGSLSPRYGASSGCGLRKALRYGG